MSGEKDLEQLKKEAAEKAKELAKQRLAEKQAGEASVTPTQTEQPEGRADSQASEDEKDLAKKKAAAAAKAKAAALAKMKATGQSEAQKTEEASTYEDDSKAKAIAAAKAKAAAAAKAKVAALAKMNAGEDTGARASTQTATEDREASETTGSTDEKAKAIAVAKAKAAAAAAAKAKAAALAKQAGGSTTAETTDAGSDEKAKAIAAAKAKAVAAAKAKAAALAKQAGGSTTAETTVSGGDEKAKAIAAAKAKAAAAVKARAAVSAKMESDAPVEDAKPSPNQPFLDKYLKVIEEHLGPDVLEASYLNKLSKDVPTLVAKKESYYKIAQFLKFNELLSFDFLSNLHGTDFETHMEIYVHLFSYKNRQSVALKVKIDRNEPTIDSLQPLWNGANWPECEVFDLLGVKFTGHPNLYRIMLGEEWIGHPLRKDYEPYDVEV